VNKKRRDYLEWPEYFMAVAFLSAQRSKDPATQVGSLLSQMQSIYSYCSVVFKFFCASYLWVQLPVT